MEGFRSSSSRLNQFPFDPFLDIFVFDSNSSDFQSNQNRNTTSFKKGRFTISRIPTSHASRLNREHNQERFKISFLPQTK
jgi:hypothetical protein